MGKITIALLGDNTRVYIADTTDLVEKARLIHSTTPVATAAIGRSITVASLMGKMLKGEKEKLTFQIKGSNLIKSIVAVAWPNGNVKAYISNPNVHIENHRNGKLNVGKAIGKDGELIVIKDLGLKKPYIGRTNLVSGEIAEDLAKYYMQSEQQPSVVSLGVHLSKDLKVDSSGGLILQPMPSIKGNELIELEKAALNMPRISTAMAENNSHLEILKKMFSYFPVKIIGEYDVELKCDCSKEKFEAALISLGNDEIKDMMEKDKKAELSCQFCNSKYKFTYKELEKLYEKTLN